MPKKKLTKAQVRNKVTTLKRMLRELTIDKMDHGSTSFVPSSLKVMIEHTQNVAKMMPRKYWMSMNIYHIELPDWFTASFVEKIVMRVALLYLVGSYEGVI